MAAFKGDTHLKNEEKQKSRAWLFRQEKRPDSFFQRRAILTVRSNIANEPTGEVAKVVQHVSNRADPPSRMTCVASCFRRCTLALLFVAAGAAATSGAVDIRLQRKQFVDAQTALRAGDIPTFNQIASRISDYPLHPYLIYDYMRPRLWKLEDEKIASFLEQYGDLPMANDIRASWLRLLAQRGRWQIYKDHYTPQNDISLKCYHLLARIKTGSDAYLLEDARTLWLSGESQPPQCDPAFERLYDSDLMTSDLVWSRMRLAMERGGISLATWLSKRLPAEHQKWAGRWIAMHQYPSKWTQNPGWEDSAQAREILLHGMRRLSGQNLDRALLNWRQLRSAYAFSPGQETEVDRLLAVNAARNKHKLAKELLDGIDNSSVDEELFQWRLRIALQDNDWQTLLRWTAGRVPEAETIHSRWIYWRARALENSADAGGSAELFRSITSERDYYGFMAADRLGIPYELNHHPLPEDLAEWQRLNDLPAVQRARELYLLGMTYSARREWHHALEGMTSYQMQIAAMIAADWGWHDRTILTMGKAEAYDDLLLRFPVPFEDALRRYADKRGLDLAWLFALVRAESAFMEDARSPAGALGLMQVMPVTAKETARSIGWRNYSVHDLLKAQANIPIGTAYLKFMLDRFDRNIVLATAAYNAGPGNVSSWIPKHDCLEPDVWIEKIPFEETRKYVQRILYYSSIYDWRLRQDITPVAQRMAAVHSQKPILVAGLSCAGRTVSMN